MANQPGIGKAVESLWAIFAQPILKLDELPPDPKDNRVYDLNPLQQGFDPVFDLASGISDVAVKRLRLSSKVKQGDRIILEADTTTNPNAVYDLDGEDRQIDKAASIQRHPDGNRRFHCGGCRQAVQVCHHSHNPPYSCSLKYDEQDLKLREMLEASGIEKRTGRTH